MSQVQGEDSKLSTVMPQRLKHSACWSLAFSAEPCRMSQHAVGKSEDWCRGGGLLLYFTYDDIWCILDAQVYEKKHDLINIRIKKQTLMLCVAQSQHHRDVVSRHHALHLGCKRHRAAKSGKWKRCSMDHGYHQALGAVMQAECVLSVHCSKSSSECSQSVVESPWRRQVSKSILACKDMPIKGWISGRAAVAFHLWWRYDTFKTTQLQLLACVRHQATWTIKLFSCKYHHCVHFLKAWWYICTLGYESVSTRRS